MNPAFNIQGSEGNPLSTELLLLIGFQQVDFVTISNEKQVNRLVSFNMPADSMAENIKGYLEEIISNQPVLQNGYKKINVIYNFPASVIVPHEFFNESAGKEMLELVFGFVDGNLIKTDFIYQHNLHNFYTVPVLLHTYLAEVFPAATFTHLYSVLPETIGFDNNHLYCIFGSNDVTLMLLKNKQLQIMQQFIYKTPEDVVYHLLNVCSNFSADTDDTIVHLNGMLDENSNLYKELYKYFSILQFETLSEKFTYPAELKNYPEHYFSHLFGIASCV